MKRANPDPRLHCTIEHLDYDFRSREGRIHFPGLQCADMGGCIGLFQAIDPKVQAIQTFDSDGPSTRYVLVRDGWISQAPARGRVA